MKTNGGYTMNLIYGIKDKPKFGQMLLFAV